MTTVSVGVEWINNFHDGACSQNQLEYMDTHAAGFQNAMVSHGHVKVFDWGDDNAWETDFRHPDFGQFFNGPFKSAAFEKRQSHR